MANRQLVCVVLALFVGYFIVTDPVTAAPVARDAASSLAGALGKFVEFLDYAFSDPATGG